MRDRRGAPIRRRRSRMPVRIWPLKTPVCGARTNVCAWSGRFQKNAAHFLGSAEMKFRLIANQRETLPVRVMCDVLGVSPAGYYAWRGRPESLRKMANRALLTEIRRVHMAHRGRYGAPRIYAALRARGYMVSRGRVERLRYPGNNATAVSDMHHRQPSRFADRPQPARPKIHRRAAQSGLARRHHLRANQGRVALFGRRARSLHPQNRRLGDAWPHAGGIDHRGPDHGHLVVQI